MTASTVTAEGHVSPSGDGCIHVNYTVSACTKLPSN